METIEAAAIMLADGRVLSLPRPSRHPSVILLAQEKDESLRGSLQGFMTSTGRFVNRHEAFKIAEAAHQLIPNRRDPVDGMLFSEDVW